MAQTAAPETEDLQALFDRLRHTCEALEEKNVKLEDAVELHEEGKRIEQRIRDVLDAADRRVVEVMSPDGKREPFMLAKK